MSIQARYPGTCRDCGGKWQPGDLIRPEDEETWPPRWRHNACPDNDPLTSEHPVCQKCWLTHPEGACDR